MSLKESLIYGGEGEGEQTYLFHSALPYITKKAQLESFSFFLMHVSAVTLTLNFKWYHRASIRQNYTGAQFTSHTILSRSFQLS